MRLGEAGLQILCNFFELVNSVLALTGGVVQGILQAMVNMVLNEDFLGLRYRFLYCVELLSNIQARPLILHHLQDAAQVAFRSFEAFHDSVMMVVGIGLGGHWLR